MAEGLTQFVEEEIAEIRRTFKNEGSTEGSFVEPILAFVHAAVNSLITLAVLYPFNEFS